jgi:hypothetical protein
LRILVIAVSSLLLDIFVNAMPIERAWDCGEQRLCGEVADAREVQRVLVPADIETIPGLSKS